VRYITTGHFIKPTLLKNSMNLSPEGNCF